MTAQDKQNVFLFLHVPKTAGTSLTELFSKNMQLNGDFIDLGPGGDKRDKASGLPPFCKRHVEERRLAKVVIGHDVNIHTHRLVPGKRPRYVVFLRRPAARLVSAYNYEMSELFINQRKWKTVMSFDEWYAQQERDVMTKMLAKRVLDGTLKRSQAQGRRWLQYWLSLGASADVLDAVNRALKTFWFVGCTEFLDRDLPVLLEKMGIAGRLERHVVSGKDFPKRVELDPALEKRLDRENPADVSLYQTWRAKRDESLKSLE